MNYNNIIFLTLLEDIMYVNSEINPDIFAQRLNVKNNKSKNN